MLLTHFMGKKDATTTTTDASGAVITVAPNTAPIPPYYARPDSLSEGAVYNPIPQRVAPLWPLDSLLDITIVVSPSFVAEPLAKVPKDMVVLDETSFLLGNFEENRVIDTIFDVPKQVQNNGTLWAHLYVGLSGSKLDPAAPGYDALRAYHFTYPMTQYITQKRVKKTKNLLAASDEIEVVFIQLYRFPWLYSNSPASQKKRSLPDQSSRPITIPTSPCPSSQILEP